MTTGLLITTAGQNAIIADLGGGADLVLTQVAWGDANGVPYNPNAAQVALVNEKYRAAIASVAVVGGAIVVDAVIPADTNDGTGRPSHSFNVAEVGLFSASGTLIGVARCGNGYKPPPSSGQASAVTYRLKLAVANPSAIAVTADPQAQISVGRMVRPFWLTVDGVVNDPPGAPALGATYVIGAAPTGAWAGFANRLAQWVGVWTLAIVPDGHVICDFSKAESSAQRYMRKTAIGWVSASASTTAQGVTLLATPAETRLRTSSIIAVTPASLVAVVGAGLDFRTVISASTTNPPALPDIGDAYLIPISATGAWAGLTGRLATFDGSSWLIDELRLGARVVDRSQPVTSPSRELRQLALFAWTAVQANSADYGLTRRATPAELAAKSSAEVFTRPSDIEALIAANKSPFNLAQATSNSRTTYSSITGYQTVLSGTYTKKSATSLIDVRMVLNVLSNATYAAGVFRIVVGGVNGDKHIAVNITSSSNQTSPHGDDTFSGIPVGAVAWSLQIGRDDGNAWTTVWNPDSTNTSNLPSSTTTVVKFQEREP